MKTKKEYFKSKIYDDTKYPIFDFGIASVVITEYNTNNSWGFAGGRGLIYTFNENLYAKIGLAGTRHHGEFPYITIYLNDERVFDESNTPKLRNIAKQTIHKILKNIQNENI